jgi:hypothetical protein
MNLGELKTRVKRQFGDESGVQITDADIIRWANDAQREIIMQNETVLQSTQLDDLVANQDNYPLPADLMVLRSVRIRTSSSEPFESIKSLSLNQFDETIQTWDSNPSTGLSCVYTTYDGQIFLFPKPSTSFTDGLKILYSQNPTDLVNDSDPIALPLIYHNAVVKYCLVQAYELDEDWEGSANKLAQFVNDLNVTAERENAGAIETYPTITVREEDL